MSIKTNIANMIGIYRGFIHQDPVCKSVYATFDVCLIAELNKGVVGKLYNKIAFPTKDCLIYSVAHEACEKVKRYD